MEKGYIWIWIGCLAGLFCGCSQQYDHRGKTPLVEVAGQYLYQEDLQIALPLNLSSEDSTLFAENYIRNWVEDALLYKKAKDNVRDSEKMKTLVENYHKALITHSYQEELINQQLAVDITQEEIVSYFEKNESLFVLDKPIVKGLFIKLPLKAVGLSDVRRWYKRNSQESIENIEKYSLRNAVAYDYFYDQWRPLEEIEAMIPIKDWNVSKNNLRQNQNIELKDTAFHYFLPIEEFQGEGEQKPLDFAQNEIKEILVNLKRVDFINQVKEDLYHQASDKNSIIYYYLNSDE